MSEITIIGNGHCRDISYVWDIPAEILESEFSWIADSDYVMGDFTFFKYRGEYYCLSDFMRIEGVITPQMREAGFHEFDGYQSDSFFSGILVKYCDDPFCEGVKVYTYYS